MPWTGRKEGRKGKEKRGRARTRVRTAPLTYTCHPQTSSAASPELDSSYPLTYVPMTLCLRHWSSTANVGAEMDELGKKKYFSGCRRMRKLRKRAGFTIAVVMVRETSQSQTKLLGLFPAHSRRASYVRSRGPCPMEDRRAEKSMWFQRGI